MLQPNNTFVVRRQAPELITPAEPTHRELKLLSDIDDQDELRCQVRSIHFFPRNPEMEDKNPATVIREALARVLVFYYPFAGRLKEGSGRKLMVDCTAEGALFIEAEADVTLDEFGESRPHPPFPCLGELLYDVPGSSGILDSPLLLIQVTRLLCGGFIFASRMNHTMCDGQGAAQFLIALGEIAQGASQPSILPVWQRELLFARDPPCVKFIHPEYKEKTNPKDSHMKMDDQMTPKTFFFGPSEVSALRRSVPDDIKNCTTYEVLTASIWRCRTIALEPNPEQEMRFMFAVNARAKLNPPIPVGYYGNCVVHPCASSTAQDLSNKPLAHALQLVRKAKSSVSEEFVRSTIDVLVIRGRPSYNYDSTYAISNLTRVGFDEIDFGWGKATYGGPAFGELAYRPDVFSYYVSSTNSKGESGIMISLSLPNSTMEKFIKELNKMLM